MLNTFIIIEPNRIIICPQPWRLNLRELRLRTAVLEIKHTTEQGNIVPLDPGCPTIWMSRNALLIAIP